MAESKQRRRNEPCWCGSERKYKRCHRDADRAKSEAARADSASSYRPCEDLAREADQRRHDGDSEDAFRLAIEVVQRGHLCGAWEAAAHLVLDVLLERKEIIAALSVGTDLIQMNPRCPQGWYQLGRALDTAGQWSRAADAYAKASALGEAGSRATEPADLHVHLFRTAIRAGYGHLIEPFLERWTTPPGTPEGLLTWSMCLFEARRLDDAEQLLAHPSLAPRRDLEPAVLHERGMIALMRGDGATAVARFEAAAAVAGADAHQCWIMLAAAERLRGNTGRAVAAAKRAIAARPCLGYAINLAAALATDGQHEAAITEYRRILDAIPDHQELRYSFAFCLYRGRRLDDAIDEMRRLESHGGQIASASANLGVMLASRDQPGDRDEALARHERALTEQWPAEHEAILRLNTVLLLARCHRLDEALTLCRSRSSHLPTWAQDELRVLVTNLESETRQKIVTDVLRMFGEEALAAMLSVPVLEQKRGERAVHRAPATGYSPEAEEAGMRVIDTTRQLTVDPDDDRRSHSPTPPSLDLLRPRTPTEIAADVQIGIITALPKELAAVKAMLDEPVDWLAPGQGAGRRYVLGFVPARDGGRHAIGVALLPATGNNIAAVRATQLLDHFENAQHIIMCGIAGGISTFCKPDSDLRLGDIAISDRRGVVQYDFGAQHTGGVFEARATPSMPAATMLEAVAYLESERVAGGRPWEVHILRGLHLEDAVRPADEFNADGSAISYVADSKRTAGMPRIFHGPVAAANILLRDAERREQLRTTYKAIAVEMESSGIADAAWLSDRAGYLAVRGICDYCDKHKGDLWQAYAAVAAASYVRALLESMPLKTH